MDIKALMKKAGLFIGFWLVIALSASSVSAWGGGRHGGNYHSGYYHGSYGHYHGWGFYRPYYWGLDFGYVTPSMGAVVAYMPDGYTTVVVNGIRYYYCDGYYFRSCPSGYVIVPEPDASASSAAEPAQTAKSQTSGTQTQVTTGSTTQAAPSGGAAAKSENEAAVVGNTKTTAPTTAPAKASSNDGGVTINIPNSGGGFTAVKLTKYKDGYKGPQGEFYPNHPTVDELKALYGGAQ